MLRSAVSLLFFISLGSCATTGQTRAPASKWSVGFWFWGGSEVTSESKNLQLDSVYFQAGRFDGGELPLPLPLAKEYWMVIRYENRKVPSMNLIPELAERLKRVQSEARRRRLPLVGIQLDIDSPTGSLRDYAVFLRGVRKALPEGTQLSITALLDWFREGTAIQQVLNEVDEFVPQFYDLSDSERAAGGNRVGVAQSVNLRPIAGRIDSQVWAARFNRYAKRYRIGISSFGRSGVVSAGNLQVYYGLQPLPFGLNAAFSLQTARTPADELFLNFRAVRSTQLGYVRFEVGDRAQFVVPTSEAIREAYDSAKRMGGYCAGVLFFRWPVPGHELALSPVEVLHAIGRTQADVSTPRVIAKDGGCAAVECVDLHLFNADSQASSRRQYTVTSSVPLEYFLPEKDIPVRLASPNEVEVVTPPFSGVRHLYLGRAVTATPSEFSVTWRPQ
jgi:hypothetical protein